VSQAEVMFVTVLHDLHNAAVGYEPAMRVL
jgi:hypothetical protein